jgi:hypothetical protein
LFLKQHTTRSFEPAVQREIEQFGKIRNLIVNLNVFSGAPLTLWAEFPKLEQLTIASYPFDQVRKPETCLDYDPDTAIEIEFLVSKAGSKYAARAEWILQSAKASFESREATIVQVDDSWTQGLALMLIFVFGTPDANPSEKNVL